jgi:hypothetical protein
MFKHAKRRPRRPIANFSQTPIAALATEPTRDKGSFPMDRVLDSPLLIAKRWKAGDIVRRRDVRNVLRALKRPQCKVRSA